MDFNNNQQTYIPVKSTEHQKGEVNNKAFIIVGAVGGLVTLLVAVLFIVLVAKADSDSDSDYEYSYNTSDSDNSSSDDDSDSFDDYEESKPKAGKQETVSVDESFSDTDLGYEFTINSAEINVPLDSSADEYIKKEEIGVFVELTGTNNSQYSSSIYYSDFKLLDSSGRSYNNSDFYLKDYVSKNSLPMFADKAIGRGDTATVWLAFTVPIDQVDDLSMRYKRRETKIIGSDNVIPELVKEIEITD
jgi:hypothetical protein